MTAALRRLLLLLTIAGACTPNIPEDPPPRPAVVVRFDPGAAAPVVPTPNDLAKDPATGKLIVPSAPDATAAQREFNEAYLTGLDGYPFASTAEVLFSGDLHQATIKPETVVVLDLSKDDESVEIEPKFDPERKALSIPPPASGWRRGHQYVAAIIAGSNGLRGAQNELVVGSPAWILVSGRTPLFVCEEDRPDECQPAVDIIPSDKIDPVEKHADQVAKAKRLEALRTTYAPLIDKVARARAVDRENIPIVWTFTIVDGGVMTFDPSSGVVPFPNDALRTGPDGKVNLPHPKTRKPLTPDDCRIALADPAGDQQLQLTCGLNTLDGFSTMASPISENSDSLGALDQGAIDDKTLTTTTVGLVSIRPGIPEGLRTVPKFAPCLNCLSSLDERGQEPKAPQQLQWSLEAPLDEKTTYLAYVTNDVKDDKGKPVVASPVFAFLRSKAPLVENGKSTIGALGDAQATQLEPLRAAMAPALDALEQAGVPRAKLALAFPFTTQAEGSLLEQLSALPGQVPNLPAGPTLVRDATTEIKAAAGAIPTDGIAKFFVGTFLTPVALTGVGGTLDPTKQELQRVDFVMSVPTAAAPAGGHPVTIFGHGFRRSRNDLLPIANTLAKAGQITIATDVLFHGERTSCTGSKAATRQSSDDAACAAPAAQKCNGDPLLGLCIARDEATRTVCMPGPAGDAACAQATQGRCAQDGKCQNADLAREPDGKPRISGWNIFSLRNFFATRDNLRQQVIDLAQLVRVIKSPELAQQTTTAIDGKTIGYVGQSLGGILGTLFNSVSPDTTHVVLNVPGGALPRIILDSPSFAEQKSILLGALVQDGIKPGTPAFDRFVNVIQWAVDPADPANMAYRLTHGSPNPNRKAFIQFIEGDATVPNNTNLALVRGANRAFTPEPPSFGCTAPLFCYEFTEKGDGFDPTTFPIGSRHGFLLGNTVMTAKAQGQVATFLSTGALP